MTVSFDPIHLLRALTKHKVEFILIGGFASAAWGSPSITRDLDICYSRDRENLRRLAHAVAELQGKRRGFPKGLPDAIDERALGLGDSFTLSTLYGNFDCIATPSGTTGYTDLRRSARRLELADGLEVWVSPVEDLIRMKKAAGRPRDLIEVEILSALKEERDKNPDAE